MELFKARVTALVVITAWAGFYLGSVRSGIPSFHIGLLETLAGIALISAGAAALNEVLERKSDARMVRTAGRPLASGRISLPHGLLVAFAARFVGSLLLLRFTNLVTVRARPAHRLHLRRRLHAAQIPHHARHLHRRISRRHGPAAGLDRRARPHRVARRRPLRHPLRLAVPALHGHRLALSRRLRPRRHPHAARRPARWLVHRRRSARLRHHHDSGLAAALVLRHLRPHLRRRRARPRHRLSRLHHPLREDPQSALVRRIASAMPARCSRPAFCICRCCSSS